MTRLYPFQLKELEQRGEAFKRTAHTGVPIRVTTGNDPAGLVKAHQHTQHFRDRLHQASVLGFKKQFSQAVDMLRDIHEQASKQAFWGIAALALIERAWWTLSYEGTEAGSLKVLTLSDEAQALIDKAQPNEQANLSAHQLHVKALAEYRRGQISQSVTLMKQGLHLAEEPTLIRAKLLDSLAVYYEQTGQFPQAIHLLQEACRIKAQIHQQPYSLIHEQAITHQILGRLYLLIDELDQAEDSLAQAQRMSDDLDDSKRSMSLLNDRLKLALLQQAPDRISRLLSDAKLRQAATPHNAQYANTLVYESFWHMQQGKPALAKQLLHEQALPLAEQYPSKKALGMAYRLLGAMLQREGKTQQAIDSFSSAVSVFQQQRRPDELAKTYVELGLLYRSLGHQTLAIQHLMEALRLADYQNLTYLIGPIEDHLFAIDPSIWKELAERRIHHEPLFELPKSAIETLKDTLDDALEHGENNPAIEQTKSLVSLLRVGQAIAAERDLDKLLMLIRDESQQALDAERCTVFIYDVDKNELWSRVASGLDSDRLEEIRFPAHLGLAGYVIKTGEVLNIPDAYADPRFNQAVDKKTGYKTRNLLCMPITNRFGKTIGVFQVLNKRQSAFTFQDEELLQAIAAQAGMSIENAMLSMQQKKAFDSFIVALSSTIDARDPITAGHSERVANFSLLISDQMSLEAADKEALKYASLLHDIGKIGIREEVLVKDGRLTVQEYEHIQKHAEYTYDILQTIHFEPHLKQVPEIAASHHEKVDGTGYFRGLKGKDIPLLGRVLALSDVFDAITSRRHYRNRMPFERVMKILRKDSGTHFDTDVVNWFFDVPLYQVADIFLDERLNDGVVATSDLLKLLDKQIAMKEFEHILSKSDLTKGESKLKQAFEAIYNVMPVRDTDNF